VVPARGDFSDGRTHGYALGLFVGTRNGAHEVYHSGSTAGYSAFLTRFPGNLVLKRRPDTTLALTPLYSDAFEAPQLGTVICRRDAAQRITALSVSEDRVWNLRFERK
jgi:hypothetical protein